VQTLAPLWLTSRAAAFLHRVKPSSRGDQNFLSGAAIEQLNGKTRRRFGGLRRAQVTARSSPRVLTMNAPIGFEQYNQGLNANPVLEAALAYIRDGDNAPGLKVFPLHGILGGKCTCGKPQCDSPGKHPAIGKGGLHLATTDETQVKRWFGGPRLIRNIGAPTGPVNGFWVLDCDDNKGGRESLRQLENQHGKLPNTMRQITGNGEHLLFADDGLDIPSRANLLPGLDVRGDGGYIVIDPSTHFSGKQYKFENRDGILPAPQWLVDLVRAKQRGRSSTSRHKISDAVKGGIDTGMIPPEGVKEGSRDVEITRWAGHCFGTGMSYEEALESCLGRNDTFDPPLEDDQVVKCVDSIWRKDSAAKAAADRPNSMESPAAQAAPNAAPQASARSPDSWKARAMRDRYGNMIPNVTNVMLALEHVFPTRFTFDQFACAVKIDRERPIEDADVIELQSWLQKQGLKRVGKDCVHDAVQARARANAYHPLREEMQSVGWDHVSRVDRFAVDYLGCEPTPYNIGIGRMFLISMVARVMNPGCQCDHMVIFEGPQGILKSSALRALASEKYFSDQLPDLGHKDSSQHLRDKWLLEISEMHTFDRATTNQLKAYITRRVERYRPSYGRLEVVEPRQCVFAGTMNPIGDSGYLRDPTGGRRFWGLEVAVKKPLDIAGIKDDRAQLFAEALVLFKGGHGWWPSAEFERTYIVPEQEARQEEEVWDETIERWLAAPMCCGQCQPCCVPGQPLKAPLLRTRTTVGEVAISAVHIGAGQLGPEAKIGRADQSRIAGCLTRLGWKRGKRTGKGKWWVPTDKWWKRFQGVTDMKDRSP